MKILVTGAHGFIGWHVVHALLNDGHTVRPIDKKSDSRMWSGGILADILDEKRMDEIFEAFKPQSVIHLAAQPSLQASIQDPANDIKINYLGTINIVNLAKKHDAKRIVFASTSAVYAPHTSGVYSEVSEIGPQTPYGISKYAAEQFIRNSGLSYIILRLGNVYGPRQVPLGENQLIPRALAHVFQNEPFFINGDGNQKRDFVYVSDVVDAFLKAVENKRIGTYNISIGASYSVNEVLAQILKATGKDIQFKHGPEKKGELRNVTLINTKAYMRLGWDPKVSLEEGIQLTVEAWPK
jgi:UDP-glucose 4-epimerase